MKDLPSAKQHPLVYFGHHKCASNWYVNVFEACCEELDILPARFNNWLLFESDSRRQALGYYEDFQRNASRAGAGFLCITDCEQVMLERTSFKKGVHVVRDPRDIIVSAYFSHIATHGLDYLPGMERNREELKLLSKREGLLCVMSFLAPLMKDLAEWRGHQDILEVRSEDIVTQPQQGIFNILCHLGLATAAGDGLLSKAQIGQILERNSFETLSGGRKVGQENTNSHYRSGKPGDWVNHFEPVHVDAFKESYNDILIKWGYEKDQNWQLPSKPVWLNDSYKMAAP